jgi:hypothetical protein
MVSISVIKPEEIPAGIKARRRTVARRIFQSRFPLFVVLWILFALYPNPLNLPLSIERVFDLNIDPAAVEGMAGDFPSAPADIEKAVLESIPYRYDWEVYSVPWYFPTVEEVLEKGEGDCKARALVLASILELKNIPYRVNLSPIHVWVDYEGKGENAIENAKVKFYEQDPETGETWFQFPEIDLREVMDSLWQGFWLPMPDGRKALLLSGLIALVAARVVIRKTGRYDR